MNREDALRAAACVVWMLVALGMRFRVGVTLASAAAIEGLSGEDAVAAMSRTIESHGLRAH